MLLLANPQVPLAAVKIATDVSRDVKSRTLLKRENTIPSRAFFQPIPNLVAGVLGEALGCKDRVLMEPPESISKLVGDNVIHAGTDFTLKMSDQSIEQMVRKFCLWATGTSRRKSAAPWIIWSPIRDGCENLPFTRASLGTQ